MGARSCEGVGALLLVDEGPQIPVATAVACAVEDRVGDLPGEDARGVVLTASRREGHGQEVRERAAEL